MSHKSHKKIPKSIYQKQQERKKPEAVGIGSAIPLNLVANECVAEKRIGEFVIASDVIDKMPFDQYQQFQSHFVIIGMTPNPQKPLFRIRAFSPLFESHATAPPQIPVYHIHLEIKVPDNPDGNITVVVTAEKIAGSRIIRPGQL